MPAAHPRIRPLRPGIAVLNPRIGRPGTLGFIARDDLQNLWAVSCHHVLCGSAWANAVDGDLIYQPSNAVPQDAVAVIDPARTLSTQGIDIAAARLLPGIVGSNDVPGWSQFAGIAEPTIGMRVHKLGITSGLTLGDIYDVNGQTVRITALDNAGGITRGGDSGAAWVEVSSGKVVAINSAGLLDGSGDALGITASVVLDQLGLVFV